MTATGLFVYEDTVGAVEIYDATGTVVETVGTVTETVEIVTPDLVGPQGSPGVQGMQGPVGDTGIVGPPGPFPPTFRMEFASPADVWIIQHNLNEYPVVDLYDFNGAEIGGDITMPDRNTVVVAFGFPVAGVAILKG